MNKDTRDVNATCPSSPERPASYHSPGETGDIRERNVSPGDGPMTWEDIRLIDLILEQMVNEMISGVLVLEENEREWYEEVLRRFSRRRKEAGREAQASAQEN